MNQFIGIDLGTSNCAVARVGETDSPSILPITQAITANGVGEKNLLPSAIYLGSDGEFPEGTPSLPWTPEKRDWLLGSFAREKGALQPDRLIVSAKSWLCHPHADRKGSILPWGSQVVPNKWSPVQASQQVLSHLLASCKSADPSIDFANLVITVPASFDEAARSLTLEAARNAGMGEVTLLEEPQAAFYAWLENQADGWRSQVKSSNLLLVCDVGGGTADFSLIAVTGKDGDLALERVAVGEHLLLGGDNMDLALAHHVAEKLASQGTSLDDWQFLSLVQAARAAKETLLSENAPPETQLAIASRSSRLLASTLSAPLSRHEVEAIALDGFFPLVDASEMPLMRRAGGLRESGLPYAADAAISKHLARFLTRAKTNVASSPHLLDAVGGHQRLDSSHLLLPDAVLFNGGVFNARPFRSRVLELLSRWAGRSVRELEGAQPDHAVAIGAAAYARLRTTGRGLRIKSGTARSYYIGMESAAMAVPGRRTAVKALCVAPQGMEEGTSSSIPDQEFFLYTGESSEFRFFQSEVRAGDTPGTLLANAEELEESARLQVEISPPPGHSPGEEVPVRMEACVTELGNLELYLVHSPSGERWKLECNVRMQ